MRLTPGAVVRLLASRRLATATMIAWVALLVIWVVPFQFYGLPDAQIRAIVYDEIFFRVVYVLLGVNTLACIGSRLPSVVRRVRRMPQADARPRVPTDSIPLDGAWSPERAGKALARAGFRTRVHGDGWAWGVRNRYAPLGNLVLHLSLFVLVAGALIAADPSSMYVGKAVVAEGETFDTSTSAFSEEPVPRDPRPDVRFTLASMRPEFHSDMLLFTRLDAMLDHDGGNEAMRLGSPWIVSPVTSVAIEDFGYALGVNWAIDDLGEIEKVFKLKVFPAGVADSFVLNNGGKFDYEVTVRVYGDYVDRDGAPGTASFNLREPRIAMDVARILSSGGRQPLVTDLLVAPGEPVRLLDSVVTIDEVDYFGVFRIVEDRAAPVLFVGVVLVAIGAAMRLVGTRQEALVARDGERVAVSVVDEAYRAAPARVAVLAREWERP